MPDLSELERSGMLPRFAFWNAVFDLAVADHDASANLRNLVRLVDKAIVEYEHARGSYTRFAGKETAELRLAQEVLRAANHVESCFNALHRAVETARVLQRIGAPLRIKKAELPSRNDSDRIRDFRNATEHAREWFGDGRLPEGQVIMIRAWPEGLEFGGDEIPYDEIAGWLRQMHELCERLSDMVGQVPPTT